MKRVKTIVMMGIIGLLIIVILINGIGCNNTPILTKEMYDACAESMKTDPTVIWDNNIGCTHIEYNKDCINLSQYQKIAHTKYPTNWNRIDHSKIEVNAYCEGGNLLWDDRYCEGQPKIYKFMNIGSKSVNLCWN